jgi:hypothetical protein
MCATENEHYGRKGSNKVLDEHAGLKYRIEDIDDFLFSLDNDSRTGISSRKGPFSTFPTCDQTEERRDQQKSTTLQQQGDFSTPRRPDSNQDFLHEGGVDDTNHADTNAFDADEVDANESSSFPLFADLYNKSGDFLGDWLRPHDIMWSSPPDREESDDHNRNVSNYFGDEYLECLALTVETDTVNGRELHMEAIKDLACAPPLNCIGGSPFEDVAVSYLLHHYTIHVADILQPILHPQNPYRGLYIPAALEGALISQMGPQGDKDNVHVALYHAILASSAFHLWNCDRSQLKYREIGVRHRHHAFHQLQIAANSSTASSNYRAFLMVILCLLTIGVGLPTAVLRLNSS